MLSCLCSRTSNRISRWRWNKQGKRLKLPRCSSVLVTRLALVIAVAWTLCTATQIHRGSAAGGSIVHSVQAWSGTTHYHHRSWKQLVPTSRTFCFGRRRSVGALAIATTKSQPKLEQHPFARSWRCAVWQSLRGGDIESVWDEPGIAATVTAGEISETGVMSDSIAAATSSDDLVSAAAATTMTSAMNTEVHGSPVGTATGHSTATATAAVPSVSLTLLAGWYAHAIRTRPILTKSVTSGIIFGFSDYLAQRLEARNNTKYRKVNDADSSPSSSLKRPLVLNRTRLLSTLAVGMFYFGPAAHIWYEWIFRVLPSTTLTSTLQKAALGQLIFGPAFTCVFFAVALLQAKQFTLLKFLRKIQSDLPGAWLAGIGFWPLVDLVSYSVVPINYIPLFINICSLIWTVYLSFISNR